MTVRRRYGCCNTMTPGDKLGLFLVLSCLFDDNLTSAAGMARKQHTDQKLRDDGLGHPTKANIERNIKWVIMPLRPTATT